MEYAVILGVVVLMIFVALRGVASETVGMWEDVSTKSSTAIGGQ